MQQSISLPFALFILVATTHAAAQPGTPPDSPTVDETTPATPVPVPPSLEPPAPMRSALATPPFGSRGQWALSSALDLSLSSSTFSADPELSQSSFGISPSVDVFIAEHISVGGFVSGSVRWNKGYTNGYALETVRTTNWGVGGRLGYDWALSDQLSIWLRVNFSYGASKTHNQGGASSPASLRDLSDQGGSVGASVPLMVHVAPHAFVGFGPYFWRTLAHSQEGYVRATGNGTIFGASFLVGGWL